METRLAPVASSSPPPAKSPFMRQFQAPLFLLNEPASLPCCPPKFICAPRFFVSSLINSFLTAVRPNYEALDFHRGGFLCRGASGRAGRPHQNPRANPPRQS